MKLHRFQKFGYNLETVMLSQSWKDTYFSLSFVVPRFYADVQNHACISDIKAEITASRGIKETSGRGIKMDKKGSGAYRIINSYFTIY